MHSSTPKKESVMNIYDVLKSEHKEILGMVSDLKSSSPQKKNDRQQQFSKMRDDLLPHMHAEENYFYPYIMDHGGKRQIILEGIEEHRAARSVMQDMESTPASDERWMAKLSVLGEMLEHHIEEEEKEIFKEARKVISDEQAKEMGDRFKSIEQGELAGR